jgi:hypothetical protein
MTKIKNLLLAAGCITALCLSSGNLSAQPPGAGGAGGAGFGGGRGGRGGNFDPAAQRANMVARYKDTMEVTDDAEWAVIGAAIDKVLVARADVQAGTIRAGRGGRGGAGGPGGAPADPNAPAAGGRQRGGGFGGTPSAEAADLQAAIDQKAPADVIKDKLAKLRASNDSKEAKLVSAQEDLKKLLTARQEAIAVLGGLLK